MKALCVPLALLPGLCLLAACTETVEVDTLPPHVAFVGPNELTTRGIVTWFGVEDEDTRLVKVNFEVCIANDCFSPDILSGSTSLDSAPSSSGEALGALPVYWRPNCARMRPQTPFTVQVSVEGSDLPPLRSPPTSLNTLAGEGESFCF